jgi:polynucleotide 5'-hydroxyl-kinase GRC3/NOL9
MERQVEEGKTLLVSGPTSITLTDGRAKVLGSYLKLHEKVVIRRGKTLPFEAEENSVFDVVLSERSSIEEVEGSTITDSWRKTTEEVLAHPKPCTVLTLGGVDCGKTTFCTFLANRALALGLRTVVIDADLGQSSIGPPATIGVSLVQEPVSDLFYLKAQSTFFAGITSPSSITERVIEGVSSLKQQAEDITAQFTIINTDGWIQGESAKEFKSSLIRSILPQAIIGIQHVNELEHIFNPAEEEGFKIFRLKPSPAVRIRGREARRELREQGYKKFLRGNTLRSLPISWIQLEYTPLGKGNSLNGNGLNRIGESIGCRIIYCEETPKELFIVLEEGQSINEKNAKLEELPKKKLYVVNDGYEEGLLVGLLDQNRQFLGLGVISKVDYERQSLKLFTSCKEKISIVQFGQMKINTNGGELGVTKSFST